MWNRKAKRIAELEAKLENALNNLVNVTVPMPPNVDQTIRGVEKGLWHRVSYLFMVPMDYPDGSSSVSDVFVGQAEVNASYFDGGIFVPQVQGFAGGLKGD